MRSRAEVSFVLELVRAGWNDCEIARETGIPRRTILDWRSGRTPDFDRVRTQSGLDARSCPVCDGDPLRLPQVAVTYPLGLYLGLRELATSAILAVQHEPDGWWRQQVYCGLGVRS